MINRHKQTEIYMKRAYNTNYFEGWYYKQVSKNTEHIISFIPSVSFKNDEGKAYLQVIYQNNDELFTGVCEFNINKFKTENRPFSVKIANNHFTKRQITIALQTEKLKIRGQIKFSALTPLEYSHIQPNIMGAFSYLPFMQCKHGIISMLHHLDGNLVINEEIIDFTDGKGYIEKDWGSSFPKKYMWIQCNHFQNSMVSLFFSVADIPITSFSFQGFICNLLFEGKQFRFATYTGAKIRIVNDKGQVNIELKSKRHILRLKAKADKSRELLAPLKGEMNTQIKEALSGNLQIELLEKSTQKTLYQDVSNKASMEIVDY